MSTEGMIVVEVLMSSSSRVHIFLWFLSKNKILTRDNLGKRSLEPYSYFSCSVRNQNRSPTYSLNVLLPEEWEIVSDVVGWYKLQVNCKLWLCKIWYN
jgi:hypothetical protein